MSRLNDLLRELRTREPALAADLEREVAALADRRPFGLNFERHVPEAVELPGRRVRKGDKVRVLPPRGQTPTRSAETLWRVVGVDRSGRSAQLQSHLVPAPDNADRTGDTRAARPETMTAALDDLIVVAEFRDPIYPGLVSTGRIERGSGKPFHTVINAENFHGLQTTLFTHRGKVDAIYIDPPYNSGARDWKYNNDYVEGDDLYRHSKWLAMMERRLLLAKELLNQNDSAMVVTIDEKEVRRLGLLLEQTFPEATIQMVTSVISQNGTSRDGEFSRVEEYLYMLRFGRQAIVRTSDNMLASEGKGVVSRVWFNFMRTSTLREDLEGQFYPIIVDRRDTKIVRLGEAPGRGKPQADPQLSSHEFAVWPIRDDGRASTWGAVPDTAREILGGGFLRVGGFDKKTERWSIHYVREGDRKRIEEGVIEVVGIRRDGSKELEYVDISKRKSFPKTVWNRTSHDATAHGTRLLKTLLPARSFPYPKSLYAVEDTLRFFVANKPNAVVLDFFAGSGTTAHAVMRLNKQDGGSRQCISITNNEVAADEQRTLRERGLRSGDGAWEQYGICEYITKPRIAAAITGSTPDGGPIDGDYKFTDEFPISDGFEENVEFFTLTYEAPLRVASNREFAKIAPMLWMRAGSVGRRIDDISTGWDVADAYGVLANLDHTQAFLTAVAANTAVVVAYIVTDEDRLFESVAQELPSHVEPVRLYEAYLRNFEIESGRGPL